MEVDTGVTGAFMAMMLVNIGVMCSAGRNGKHIRWRINLITERKLEDNLVDSATSSDALHPITSGHCTSMRASPLRYLLRSTALW